MLHLSKTSFCATVLQIHFCRWKKVSALTSFQFEFLLTESKQSRSTMIFYKCLKGQFYQSRKTFTVWGLDSGSFRSWQQLQGQRGQMENLKTCSKSSFICSIHNSNSPVVVWQRLARRPCGFPAADIPLFPVQTSPCIGPFLPASKLSGNFCLVWESIVVHYNWSKDVMSKVDHSFPSV